MRMRYRILACLAALVLPALFRGPSAALARETFSPRAFTVRVSRMEPQRWASRSVAYGYSLTLRNDSVSVDLPYMGVAHLPRLGDTLPRFTAPVSAFSVRKGRKGRVEVSFRAFHADSWYTIRVSARPDSRAGIFLSPSHAESIRYEGDWEQP